MSTGEKKRTHRDDAQHISFLRHANFRYLKIAFGMCVLALVIYLMVDITPRHNGGTWYGYTTGTIGAVLIVWLAWLGRRKRVINAGRWKLVGWTSAHVYLGLSLLVIATLHTGFQVGWNVHTLAYFLMIIVIVSGIFGIYFYANIPGKMSQNREENTQADMIEELNALDKQLADAAQPLEQRYISQVRNAIEKTRLTGGLFTRLSGRVGNCATTKAALNLKDALDGSSEDMRGHLESVNTILDRKVVMLGRARRHIRYKTLLELWLYIHVPVTFALLAALTVHIISVFFYW